MITDELARLLGHLTVRFAELDYNLSHFDSCLIECSDQVVGQVLVARMSFSQKLGLFHGLARRKLDLLRLEGPGGGQKVRQTSAAESDLLGAIKRFRVKVDEIARRRNDIVHGVLILDLRESAGPSLLLQNVARGRIVNLNEKDVRALLESVIQAIQEMRGLVARLSSLLPSAG